MRQCGRYILSVALLLALGAPVHAADADSVKALIKEAEMLRDEAARLEFEWRWTSSRIKEAKEALKAGDIAAAEKSAARAKREAELAIEQAATAEKVWEIAVPK